MSDRPAVIYQYDGTLAGLLCCIFAIYEDRQPPAEIQPEDSPQEWLYPIRLVDTDQEKAARVHDALGGKICPAAREWVETAFLCGGGGKEMAIYRFVRLGLRKGAAVVQLTGHPDVSPLYDARRAVLCESHHLMGFVRFADLGGLLAAEITPKHFVLPLLEPHFTDRFPQEQFLIHDKTHRAVLAYRPHQARLFFVEALQLPEAGAEELLFQRLWQGYFGAASIAARLNPLCQRTHCPKRHWANMLELAGQGELLPGGVAKAPPPATVSLSPTAARGQLLPG